MITKQNREPDVYDSEIDLRSYAQMFLRHWPWILVTVIVATAVAAVLSYYVLSPTYEATSLVAVTSPKYLMQFSPEFRALAQERLETEIYQTYPELAKSDELYAQVREELVTSAGIDPTQLDDLRKKMSVQASKNVGLIYLRVRDSDPELTATAVNTWAALYVRMLNKLYASEEGEYGFFVEQLSQAQSDLDRAQEALAEFRARDPTVLLSEELGALTGALARYLAMKNSLAILDQGIEDWREQLARQAGSQLVSPADELTHLLMQLEAFGIIQEGVQPQFQISLEQAAQARTVEEQIALLDSLQRLLQARLAEIDTQVSNIQPEMLRVQQELQQAENEQVQLSQQVGIASTLRESLSLKAEEARITSESQGGISRLASRASVPENPTGPRKLMNIAVGAVLGLVVGMALVVVLEVFRASRTGSKGHGQGDGRGA